MPDPTIIDLFSGVGGISLGAARAGFRVVGAIDNDARISAAHLKNFPSARHLTANLGDYSGQKLLLDLNTEAPTGIVGGPPCQGFSSIGRRKLSDVRNSLFGHFFRLVSEIKPQFFLAENVSGILDAQYRDTVDSALSQVESSYNLLTKIEVSAADYGAPTSRKRILFIGFIKSQGVPQAASIVRSNQPTQTLVGEALEGLPRIRSTWATESQGWRVVSYSDSPFSQKLKGQIPPKVGCTNALLRLRRRNEVSGCMGTVHTPEVIRRFAGVRPGSRDAVSKAPRLDPEGFCPTLRAGTSSEMGSYQAVRPIHPTSPRVITPREAARLQGFPDWFQFDATKWHSFRMIGNSVSPILAEVILGNIRSQLQ